MNGGDVIYSILSNSAGVTGVVSERIYALIDNQSYTLPFITYSNVLTSPNATKSGPSTLDEKTYQINIVAATHKQCNALAELVRSALDYANGTYNGTVLQQCYMDDERTGWFDKITNDGGAMIMQDYVMLIER